MSANATTEPAHAQPAALTKYIKRRDLAPVIVPGGVSEFTLMRWEQLRDDPLPVVRVGKFRLYDPDAVRAWIARRQARPIEEPKLGRPAGKRRA